MATRVFEVSSTGATAGSLEDNLGNLNDRQKAAFGEDLSLSPQTPQAQWSGINALALSEVGEAGVRSALYGSSVDHAQGVYLDAFGSLLDIRRRVETKSRVTATLAGVAGTGIPAGSRARTEAGAEFETLEDVVLSAGGVQVEMRAIDPGPVLAPSATLTRIVTVIGGWESVTNARDATPGVDRQSDDDYRASYTRRTAHSSIGPLSALEAAIDEALAGKQKVAENNTSAAMAVQSWNIDAHSILVVSEEGSDGDIRRAVENHRGMGVGTMTAIRAGEHTNTSLASVTNGTITWNGTDYTGLDLSSAGTGPLRAAALTELLEDDSIAPTISFIDGQYVAIFRWSPTQTPNFAVAASNDAVAAFGFSPTDSTYPGGPFIRAKERGLSVSLTLTRRQGFPADGLSQVRDAILNRVKEYEIGEEVWNNDLLCAAEAVRGTRITNLSVEYNSASVDGVAVELSALWTLASSDLTITVV